MSSGAPGRELYSFDHAAHLYEESRRVPDDVLARLARCLLVAGRDPWLDVGVGAGRAALPLTRAGARVVGIDVAPAMMARLRAAPDGKRVSLVRGDFRALPFARGTFGAAVGYHVLHLVSDPAPLFSHLAAVLAPGAPLYWLSDLPEGEGSYGRLKARYAELIRGRHPFGKPSSRDGAFVEAALHRVGARFRDVEAPELRWERRSRRDDVLTLFEAKALSMLFGVPDGLHRELMVELAAWARVKLPAEETLPFRIRVVEIDLREVAR